MVLHSGDTYARLGPRISVLEEQIHTVSMYERGFPVPQVLESGPYGNDQWYYVEQSVGKEPFHKIFVREMRERGQVSDASFQAYMGVMDRYVEAQVSEKNRTSISAEDFVRDLLPRQGVLQNYCYFGFGAEPYEQAIQKAIERLAGAPMGVLQYDLNPYNILEGGIIDFELVGYGPIAFDVLTCSRWGGSWFTAYPSRYPVGYSLSDEQIKDGDNMVREKALAAGVRDPNDFLEEFLLLKTAWSVLGFDAPRPDWPPDKTAFRRFRANLLGRAVTSYLAADAIDYWNFPHVPGGELEVFG
jgi:hypothetical protein